VSELDVRSIRRLADMQAVYRMFDATGHLLYIGITSDLTRRLGQHAEKRWFPQVKTISLEWYPTQAAAFVAEQRAIRQERPRMNITGKRHPPVPVKRKPKPLRPAPPLPSGPITLRQAAAAGMWPNVEAARKAVQRAQLEDAGYRGAAKLYTIEALATARRRKADR
jgi:predicted GIY-YIG superfamily endonuclease